MKTVISKSKLEKIETILYSSLGATALIVAMEGKVTDGVIKIRNKTVKDIMKLLTN